MKRIFVALILSVSLASCWGGDDGAEPLPPLTEADVLTVVPPGWGLLDWALASDGMYAAVLTESPRSMDFGTPQVASVYQPSARGPIEVARVAQVFGGLELAGTAPLEVDETGTRGIDVVVEKGPFAQVRIAASGEITVEYLQALGDGEPAQTFMPASDPLDEFVAQPLPDRQGGSWTLPAGVVPGGWMVTGAGTSPNGRYVAVTTEPAANTFGGQLSVYRIDGERLREEFRAANEYMSLHEELVFKDITGDGTMEIVYGDTFGGTGWLNGAMRAATIADDGSVRAIEFELPITRSTPSSPEDINGDGIYEWWATDASWELEGFCHPCSPRSSFVLAWDGAKYADASRRFGSVILARSGWGEWDHPPVTCEEQDLYMSSLIARFLDRYNAGRTSEAEGMLARLRALVLDARLEAKRDRIVEALERDPHMPYDIEWALCE